MRRGGGLLFDIAGVLRLFLLDELIDALEPFKEHENLPSVAMRELIMPEASGPYTTESHHVSIFYYNKRGVLFLFIGFASRTRFQLGRAVSIPNGNRKACLILSFFRWGYLRDNIQKK